MRAAARFLCRCDLIKNTIVIAGQKNAAIDHHIDFVCAIARGGADFLKL